MGTRKIISLGGILASSAFFVFSGMVIYEIALPLMVTGALGGWAGARFAMKRGDKWIRVFFIAVVSILAVKMLLGF